jgi:hypothetical protein
LSSQEKKERMSRLEKRVNREKAKAAKKEAAEKKYLYEQDGSPRSRPAWRPALLQRHPTQF